MMFRGKKSLASGLPFCYVSFQLTLKDFGTSWSENFPLCSDGKSGEMSCRIRHSFNAQYIKIALCNTLVPSHSGCM